MNNSEITVLNVDACEAGRLIKSDMLREAGYRVMEAGTGADALRQVAEQRPQLVLLSSELPDQSGLEALSRIKAGAESTPNEGAPLVLLISATFVGCEKRARFLEEGADGYLLEPVTREFLLANIKTLLRRAVICQAPERPGVGEAPLASLVERFAQSAIAINSAESLDDILRIVTDEARDLIGANQAVTSLTCEFSEAPNAGQNELWRWTRTAVSLSERHAGCNDRRLGHWIGSLACRLNQPMRLTHAELIETYGNCGTYGTHESHKSHSSHKSHNHPKNLEEIMTPRELAMLRDLAALGEVAVVGREATPREKASLRGMAAQRDPRILRGLEMRGWLAAPLTAPDGRNLGLIQLSDKYEGEFTERDEAILERLARLSSIAIENRRLWRREQMRRLAAENASRAKDEFLATVSHKFRAPLNTLLGWAWVLRRQTTDAETLQRASEIIERAARTQTQLIEDLMEASRVITGNLRLEMKTLEIEPLVVTVCDNLRPAAEAKGVEVRLELGAQSGTISGDGGRLRDVVWNLLFNAIKFTPDGERVELRLEQAGSDLQLTIATPAGVLARDLPWVFDCSRKAEVGDRRQAPGLGLALARHLVELHGGSVSVSSPGQGRGVTFAVKLPSEMRAAWRDAQSVEEWAAGRQRDRETRRQGGWETRRHGDIETERSRDGVNFAESPCLSDSLSPYLSGACSSNPASRGLAAGGGR
jgi:signal transduction histidine kinase/DNA-binding response OmpR family regulator